MIKTGIRVVLRIFYASTRRSLKKGELELMKRICMGEERAMITNPNTEVDVRERAHVSAYGAARICASGRARVDAYDDVVVSAHDDVIVMAHDRVRVDVYDRAHVEAFGLGVVIRFEGAVGEEGPTVVRYYR